MSQWGSTYFQMNLSMAASLSKLLYECIMTINCFVLTTVVCGLAMALSSGRVVGHCRKYLKNELLEAIWTVVPAFLIYLIASMSFYVLYMNGEHKEPTLFHSVITGHQWYRTYQYAMIDEMGKFFGFEHDSYALLNDVPSTSDDDTVLSKGDTYLLDVDAPFVIPQGMPGELLVTSDDVIHSWSVPALGITVDGVPGRLNRSPILASTVGVAYGHCRELCGVNHFMMPICVEIVTPATYLKFMKLEEIEE
uniref:Cytochrome c oxidase subunit 2 n=1 Tax=Lingula anatina TaxID=7574 RepID=Q5W913_LINAN|nr:cytochrome oxidase subunit 2 [Lingula anatina]